jgi:5-methylcytosine-specific restriction endonuclease McrA
MLETIAELRRAADRSGDRSVEGARSNHSAAYERTLDEIERTFARYPIRLLQVVNGQPLPFLFDINWDERVSLRSLHNDGGGLVRFRPGASDALLRLGPLIRPLIETHWARMVASINRIDLQEERLRAHLFGTLRQAFPPPLRRDLAALHQGRCFYCDRALGNRFDLDHVVPWTRFPNDAIENLVPADPKCNNDKRDTLPAIIHVSRWAKQIEANGPDLNEIAQSTNWLTDPSHTLAIARSTYRHLAFGTPVWLERGRVELFEGNSSAVWQ